MMATLAFNVLSTETPLFFYFHFLNFTVNIHVEESHNFNFEIFTLTKLVEMFKL